METALKLLQLPDKTFLYVDAVVYWEEVDKGKCSRLLNNDDSPTILIQDEDCIVCFFSAGEESDGCSNAMIFTGEGNQILRAWLDQWRSY